MVQLDRNTPISPSDLGDCRERFLDIGDLKCDTRFEVYFLLTLVRHSVSVCCNVSHTSYRSLGRPGFDFLSGHTDSAAPDSMVMRPFQAFSSTAAMSHSFPANAPDTCFGS